MTTRSLRPRSSATTFAVVRRTTRARTRTRTTVRVRRADSASDRPTLYETPSTGMRKPAAPSVAPIALRRPRCPSFMSSTARAPADCALRAFTAKKQVPRCTSATAPRGNRRKVRSFAPARGRVRRPGRQPKIHTRHPCRDEAGARVRRRQEVPAGAECPRARLDDLEPRLDQLAEELQRKAVEPRRVAGRAERPAHVADGGVAAGAAGGPVAAVRSRDRLERGEMLANACLGDAVGGRADRGRTGNPGRKRGADPGEHQWAQEVHGPLPKCPRMYRDRTVHPPLSKTKQPESG